MDAVRDGSKKYEHSSEAFCTAGSCDLMLWVNAGSDGADVYSVNTNWYGVKVRQTKLTKSFNDF